MLLLSSAASCWQQTTNCCTQMTTPHPRPPAPTRPCCKPQLWLQIDSCMRPRPRLHHLSDSRPCKTSIPLLSLPMCQRHKMLRCAMPCCAVLGTSRDQRMYCIGAMRCMQPHTISSSETCTCCNTMCTVEIKNRHTAPACTTPWEPYVHLSPALHCSMSHVLLPTPLQHCNIHQHASSSRSARKKPP
jgi:hypothetical protein